MVVRVGNIFVRNLQKPLDLLLVSDAKNLLCDFYLLGDFLIRVDLYRNN